MLLIYKCVSYVISLNYIISLDIFKNKIFLILPILNDKNGTAMMTIDQSNIFRHLGSYFSWRPYIKGTNVHQHLLQDCLCTQQRLRPASGPTHSKQNLYRLSKESLVIWLPTKGNEVTLISLHICACEKCCAQVILDWLQSPLTKFFFNPLKWNKKYHDYRGWSLECPAFIVMICFFFFFFFFLGGGEGVVYFSGLSNRIMREIFSHWRLEPVPGHL